MSLLVGDLSVSTVTDLSDCLVQHFSLLVAVSTVTDLSDCLVQHLPSLVADLSDCLVQHLPLLVADLSLSTVTDLSDGLAQHLSLLVAEPLTVCSRQGSVPEGITERDLRRAQQLYLSAFHPDTGDLQNVIGRMSFQVPGGMVLIGAMITFYKSAFLLNPASGFC